MSTQKKQDDEELGHSPGMDQDQGQLKQTPQMCHPTERNGYYAQIPGVLKVVDIDYDKAATLCRRLIILYVIYMLLCIALAVFYYDISALFAVYIVLILVLTRVLYVVRISHRLYSNRAIHMAITRVGVRQDVGKVNATMSTVTIFHRYSNMKSVSVGKISWNALWLAPRGLQMMRIPLHTGGRPFRTIGIMDSDEKEIELLIQKSIDSFAKAKLAAATTASAAAVGNKNETAQSVTTCETSSV